jgi:HD-like signal output (HDOD) protein
MLKGYRTLTKRLGTNSTNNLVESTFKQMDMRSVKKHKRETLRNATEEAQQTEYTVLITPAPVAA